MRESFMFLNQIDDHLAKWFSDDGEMNGKQEQQPARKWNITKSKCVSGEHPAHAIADTRRRKVKWELRDI